MSGSATPISALVASLEGHGVELWEEEGKLRFRGPRGVMNDERRETLRARKEELLEYLRAAQSVTLTHDAANAHEPFPLTDIQMSYVLGRRAAFAYSGVGCHAYGELTFAELDSAKVQQVWPQLVRRHDMLRVSIDPAGSQRIRPQVPEIHVAVLDLRGKGLAAVAAGIDSVRAAMDHKVYPPDAWPLFEVRVTHADDKAVLHLSIDFLVADYVSIQLLLEEFSTLYHQPGEQLPELEFTFRDYLLGERKLRGTRQYEKDREYWWKRVDSLPPAPDLMVLGDRADGSSGVRFRRWSLHLPTSQYAEFKRLASKVGVTPSGTLLTAFAEVIARWSRRRRFTLNLTMLRRLPLHPQVGRLVGDFTSAILLEVDSAAAPDFTERAQAVQRQLWNDMDHMLVGGVEVLREVARRRGPDAALMPIVFTSALGLGTAGDSGPQEVGFGYGISQTPQVWIDCQALERPDGLVVNWDVRQGVFPADMVEDMFSTFSAIVKDLAAGAGWLEQDPVTLPEQQLARRRAVNDTAAPVSDALLHDGLVAQCLRTPTRPAILTADGELSYGNLLQKASAVAAELRRRDCQRGELVAVVLDSGPSQVIAVLGVLLAGCAYLPIDTRQPKARQESLVEGSGVRVRIGIDFHPDDLPEIPYVAGDRVANPGDRAYVIYTSGSTGKPKGVVIAHRGAVNTIEDINRLFRVGAEDRVLGLASLSFDLSVYDIFGVLAVGGALVLPSHDRRADPSHWAELVKAHKVSLWNSVPAQLQMLSDYLIVEPALSLPSLRLAMLSGDWIPVRLPDQIRSRLPQLTLHSLGGATEASIWSIGFPIEDVPQEWASIPYGRPLSNQTFHVLDDAMHPCPDWTVGELYIGGIGVADGYLGDPDLTAQRFLKHPRTGERLYRTGDLGRYLPSGDIEFLGREDLQVKIRGHRIELAEIETTLQSHPAVGNAAVVVEGDGSLDKRLLAFLEPAARSDIPEALDLIASARKELAAIRAEQDGARAVAFARQLDHTALLAMLYSLREQGLFRSAEEWVTVAEIMSTARVAPKHERLIRRWLKALERHDWLVRDPRSGRLQAAPQVHQITAETVEEAWRKVDEVQPDGGQRSELVGYFQTASQHLGGLMRDEIDPVQLLFPEGRMDIQESAYQGNFLSNTLNRLVVRAVCDLAGNWDQSGPMQILEVGAGVGGTSIDLIPALAAYDVEYLFTDVSQFFLNSAKDRFGRYPWVSYDLYDLNADYRQQGMSPQSVDVILCANVLHYAKNATHALARFREMLRPGGWLVFIETTRDNYQILTSMEFLFDATAGDFEDVRHGRDETFISAPQWRELLSQAAAQPALQLSASDEALDAIGMHVFAARFKPDRVIADPAQVRAHLLDRLPEYMIPQRLELLDAIPLTDNGKVDRGKLRTILPGATAATRGAGTADPIGPLETAIAAIWAQVINVERVGRDDDLFSLGGDSLIAAQLVGRIRDDLPEASGILFDAMLRDLLEGATVASIATGLGGSVAVAPEAETPVAPSLPAGDGLAELSFSAVDTLPSPQQRAVEYARQLGQRPVTLTGTDLGGCLAFELALQRAEAGLVVTQLVLVAQTPLAGQMPSELLTEYFYARSLGVSAADVGLPGEPREGDESVFAATAGEPQDWRLARIASVIDEEPVQVAEGYRSFRQALEVQLAYNPPLYAGDLTLRLDFDPLLWPQAAAWAEERWRGAGLGDVRVVRS